MTKFNLQAALEALDTRIDKDPCDNFASTFILRDLRERLAGAQEAWQEGRHSRISTLTAYALLFDSEQPRTRHVFIINVDSPVAYGNPPAPAREPA